MSKQIIDSDVLVIGGGGAGFRAAIGAAEKGCSTVMISKGPLARCGASPMAGADFTLDGRSMSRIDGLTGDPSDSPEKAMNDIVTQGFYLNNQKIVEQYLRVAPQCLQELIDWGIQIKAADERMVFTSGIGIMDALHKKARSAGVTFQEDVAVLDLVVEDGQVVGALGLDIRGGQFIHFRARAVVMATGGWHKAFWPNTGMRDLAGEGMAMAFRAGAQLGNLEFITFCCNVFYQPQIWRGSLAPYLMTLMVGGEMVNSAGERFLEKYDPFVVKTGTFTEWNKSILSITSRLEALDGKGLANGGVGFRRGRTKWEDVEFIAQLMFPKWKYKAIDLAPWAEMLRNNEIAEVGPAVEYFDGGIVIDEHMRTTLPGLFAAGEVTLGAFGANRVFAAITEMLVHGAEAGDNAAAYARQTQAPLPDAAAFEPLEQKALAPLANQGGLRVADVRRGMQTMAHELLGPVRDETGLQKLRAQLAEIKNEKLGRIQLQSASRTYNKEWIDAIELGNMLGLLEMSATSALARTESRGVHYRRDFPHADNDKWLAESVIEPTDSGFNVGTRPVTVTTMPLPGGKSPYMDYVKHLMESRSDTAGKH